MLKLKTGYNIGIETGTITAITELGKKEAHYKIPEKEFPTSLELPNVKLLGTGGTIASRLDYRTGAVIPVFSPVVSQLVPDRIERRIDAETTLNR